MKRLRLVHPEEGNALVVTKFGHKRFGYLMHGGDVQVDFICESSLLRAALIIPDPWVLSKTYGASRRINNIPNTPKGRRKIRGFEVAGFKYTDMAEKSL